MSENRLASALAHKAWRCGSSVLHGNSSRSFQVLAAADSSTDRMLVRLMEIDMESKSFWRGASCLDLSSRFLGRLIFP